MADQVSESISKFLEFQFGTEHQGQVYLAIIHEGRFDGQQMLEWPRERPEITRLILANNAAGKDVYYTPSLFKPVDQIVEWNTDDRGNRLWPKATKPNILGSQLAWVDWDGGAPSDWSTVAQEKGIPEPSLVIQSSVPDRQHAYWRLDEFSGIDAVEDRNKALALTLKSDSSGWDATQLLRIPFTNNYGHKKPGIHKEWYKGQPLMVKVASPVKSERVSASHFVNLASPEREIVEQLAIKLKEVPPIEDVLMFGHWTPELATSFKLTKQEAAERSPDGRSGTIQRLMYEAAEAGMSDEQMYAIVDACDRRWEKYTGRSPGIRKKYLIDAIAKARERVGWLTEETMAFAGLATEAPVEDDAKLVYNMDEFMSKDVKIEWLLEGLFQRCGFGIVTAQPGTGKTQAAIQFMLGMALGTQVLKWPNLVGEQKILFMSLEMDHAPLKHFMGSILREYDDSDYRLFTKNVNIFPKNMYLPLDKPEGMQFMENLLSQFKPDVVVFDSMSKIMSKPMTDEVAAKALMEKIDLIRSKYKCAVLIVHHDRKRNQDPAKQTEGNLSEMYGSQFISAAADWVLSLQKTADLDTVKWVTWKNRLAREDYPFLTRRNENLHFDYMGEKNDADDAELGIRFVGGSGASGLSGLVSTPESLS
ncbi:hypothetical protein [Cellulosimicrobium phage DS1]|nr:hypothetical protein [Cellulosimicrobium phage DS1]